MIKKTELPPSLNEGLSEFWLSETMKERIHMMSYAKSDDLCDLLLKNQEQDKEENEQTLQKDWPVGCNHTPISDIWGYNSSFDRAFTDEDIAIDSWLEPTLTKLGDVKEAYLLLKQKIIENENIDIYKLFEIVLETVDEYFGWLSNTDNRMRYFYPKIDDRSSENRISNLKGSGAAMCVERSALSQNLLQMLWIKSFYKSSWIIKNWSPEIHSYNLVEYNGKYYIFDSSMPNIINGKPNPLIAEINEEAFKLISSYKHNEWISITVSHYNPYQEKEYTVTYDNRRRESIEVSACE